MINLTPMKVIPFQIPKTGKDAIRVQVEQINHLYNHLHQHPEIQVTLVVASEGTLVAGDYIGRFQKDDIYVIGSNQPHVFRNDPIYFKGRKKASTITLFFDETTLGTSFWNSPELVNFLPFFSMSQGGFQVTGNKATIVRELLLEIANSDGIDKILVFIKLIQALAGKKDLKPLSAITSQRAINAVDGSRLNLVLEFSFKESHRAIPLEEVASKANMTMTAFCKYFKTRTGKTYSAFLNGIRVNNACKALLESDEPIANIGYQTGFNNLSNFNRIFKSITGTTPKAYRSIN